MAAGDQPRPLLRRSCPGFSGHEPSLEAGHSRGGWPLNQALGPTQLVPTSCCLSPPSSRTLSLSRPLPVSLPVSLILSPPNPVLSAPHTAHLSPLLPRLSHSYNSCILTQPPLPPADLRGKLAASLFTSFPLAKSALSTNKNM